MYAQSTALRCSKFYEVSAVRRLVVVLGFYRKEEKNGTYPVLLDVFMLIAAIAEDKYISQPVKSFWTNFDIYYVIQCSMLAFFGSINVWVVWCCSNMMNIVLFHYLLELGTARFLAVVCYNCQWQTLVCYELI